MDHARLRTGGIDLLERLAGGQWTDFNTHDPGITILEQLCYAITDLGYRCGYPMADLLALADNPGLPGPAAILTGDPVTSDDLRKLVLDGALAGNAWANPPATPPLDFYYHEGSCQLRLQLDPAELTAPMVRLRGLAHVVVQNEESSSGDEVLDKVAQRLHATRMLGTDFEITRLADLDVTINAQIEVNPTDDPTGLLADIVEQLEDRFAPPATRISLTDARGLPRSLRLDQIFEGPLLRGGVVERLPDLTTAVFPSDLIHAVTDVPAVRAVRSIAMRLGSDGNAVGSVNIPQGKVARLAPDSRLTLMRAGLAIRADFEEARKRVRQRRIARRIAPMDLRPLDPQLGRDRSVARYRSIQRHLPAAYGIGPLGLADSAPPERQAQARQLQAYLLIFDQLLANQFAQLAAAHELLSPDEGGTRSYFTQKVDDPPLALDGLLGSKEDTATPELIRQWLDQTVETDGLERRKRFLAHLLARYGEQLGEYQELREGGEEAVVADRQAFLSQYPTLSGKRGSGVDLFTGAAPALAERVRLKLGIPGLSFEIVEHILLRPIAEDANQLDLPADASAPPLPQNEPASAPDAFSLQTSSVPLLLFPQGLPAAPDPYSLQVCFVFRSAEFPAPEIDDEEFNNLQSFVRQTILAETPAHLAVRLLWFDDQGEPTWSTFATAWAAFLSVLRAYRWPSPDASEAELQLAQLRLRDARDRVIELLEIGLTYPLRDLPWSQYLTVLPGTPAQVTLDFSQPGVEYGLYDIAGLAVSLADGQPIVAEGTGDLLLLPTPPSLVDVSYRVRATKREGVTGEPPPGPLIQPRRAWLKGAVLIRQGIDTTLSIEILDLPLLDPQIDDPLASDARITEFGQAARIAVHQSQEGVEYQLRDHADPAQAIAGTSSVIGTSGTIVLTLPQAVEDIDLRVYGGRDVGVPNHPDVRGALLDLVLPLRVRADPAIAAELTTAITAYGGNTSLRLLVSQGSASYQAWQRPVRDGEFVFDEVPTGPTIDVPGDNRLVRIARPPLPAVWQNVDSLSPSGPAVSGNGADIESPLGSFTQDTLLLLQAIKQHRRSSAAVVDDVLIPSAVQLAQALVLLVRPDPARLLRLQCTVVGDASEGPWLVDGGQPGVYYELQSAGTAIGLSAYFHQRDDEDALFNKGIGQIRTEIDVAVARERDPLDTTDPATTPPLPPLIEASPVQMGSELQVRARKAMSGLAAFLSRAAVLDPIPALRTEPAVVATGDAVAIVIDASVVGERYRVFQAEQAIGVPGEGNGGALVLDLGVMSASAEFVIAIDRPASANLPVERRVALFIAVG